MNTGLWCGGRRIARDVRDAGGPIGRALGLMGRKVWPAGVALRIRNCASIHTCFMRFAIDVVFLDADDRITRVTRGLPPWRAAFGGRTARTALEWLAGSLPEDGLHIGDRVESAAS
ncbi:MAG: DUF192 domain-containing protein [Kiritimatiellae bacterium]|nr:DUF192 domain-containing protein [Kiritimatiellia bacterium]